MSSPYHGSQTQEFPSVSQCSSGYGSLAFHYQGRNRQSLQEPFSLNQILHPTELEQSGSNRLSVNVTVSCSEHTRHHRCNLRKDEASPQEVLPFTCTRSDSCVKLSDTHQVISSKQVQLMSYMNPRTLLPYLMKYHLLDTDDLEYMMNPNRTENEMRERILERAPYSGEGALYKFITCLEEEMHHPAHGQLAGELKLADRRLRESKIKPKRKEVPPTGLNVQLREDSIFQQKTIKLVETRRIQWLRDAVHYKDCDEIIDIASKTHIGSDRRLIHSGLLLQDGETRLVIVFSDLLLILRPSQEKRVPVLEWFCTDVVLADKPLLLHTLGVEKYAAEMKFGIRLASTNISTLPKQICLEAYSEFSVNHWLEVLMPAIEHSRSVTETTQTKNEYDYEGTGNTSPKVLCTVVEQPTKLHFKCSNHTEKTECRIYCTMSVRNCTFRADACQSESSKQPRQWAFELTGQPDSYKSTPLQMQFHDSYEFMPDELIGSTSLHNTHQFELTDVSVYVSDTDGTTIGSVTVSMQPTCDTLV